MLCYMLHSKQETVANWLCLISKIYFIWLLLCLLLLLRTSRKLPDSKRSGKVWGRPIHFFQRWCVLLFFLYCGPRRNSRREWRRKKRQILLWSRRCRRWWRGLCPGKWSWHCKIKMCWGPLHKSSRPSVFALYALAEIGPIQCFVHHHHLSHWLTKLENTYPRSFSAAAQQPVLQLHPVHSLDLPLLLPIQWKSLSVHPWFLLASLQLQSTTLHQ